LKQDEKKDYITVFAISKSSFVTFSLSSSDRCDACSLICFILAENPDSVCLLKMMKKKDEGRAGRGVNKQARRKQPAS